MRNGTTDMRLFKTIEHDHATYDACLARQFHDTESVWTRSVMRGNIPITIEHFRTDAHQKLGALLQQEPSLKGQDFSNRRKILQHIAHELVTLSACIVHLQQRNSGADTLSMVLRENLIVAAREKFMVMQSPNHPLEQDYKKQLFDVNTNNGLERYWSVPTTNEDAALARFMVGKNVNLITATSHIRELLTKAVPFLMEVEPSAIDSPLLSLRLQLIERLKSEPYFHPELRQEVIKMIVDSWVEYNDNKDVSVEDAIEDEIERETGIRKICNEDAHKIFDVCFGSLMEKGIDRSDVRTTLLRRRPLLDMLVCIALDFKDHALLCKAALIFKILRTDMNVDYRELGHLGLMFAAQSEEIEIDLYRKHLY